LPLVPRLADEADLLVICRTHYDHRIAQLAASFHARGKRVLFDTDDLVFDTRMAHLVMSTLDLDLREAYLWDFWFASISRIGETLRLCDGAITTTPMLAQRIKDFADIPVHIVPNFLNEEQMAYSDQLFEAKQNAALGEDGLIHLGYFSGSPSHNRDFAMVIPALRVLLEEDESLGVVVVGYIEPGPELERFGNRVKRFPFQDYVNLQRLIASVEYNLMPLQFNDFTHCKSELKYFDAAVVGTVSIASPTDSYRRAIRHADNGYLAQAHQWLDVLRQVLSERGAYREMATRARSESRAKYAGGMQRPAILSALSLA
jgi:glycosyltransferase involved in cell wall biosynthesis